ncbi:hypothetical protein GCM10027578_21970 [Spirosoma luteolum]
MSDAQNRNLWAAAGVALTMGMALIWAGSVRQRRRAVASTSLPLGPVVNPMTIRVDAGGNGHYNASRIGRTHQGTDVVCRAGQNVYAPFSGKVTREAVPYADDRRWRGVVLESDAVGYECKLFYCIPAAGIIGAQVERGQLIGHCQAISQKYSSGVTDHLHIEIRQKGQIQNPEQLFVFS